MISVTYRKAENVFSLLYVLIVPIKLSNIKAYQKSKAKINIFIAPMCLHTCKNDGECLYQIKVPFY